MFLSSKVAYIKHKERNNCRKGAGDPERKLKPSKKKPAPKLKASKKLPARNLKSSEKKQVCCGWSRCGAHSC